MVILGSKGSKTFCRPNILPDTLGNKFQNFMNRLNNFFSNLFIQLVFMREIPFISLNFLFNEISLYYDLEKYFISNSLFLNFWIQNIVFFFGIFKHLIGNFP